MPLERLAIVCLLAAVDADAQPWLRPRPAPPTLAIEHARVLPMDRDTVLLDQTVLITRDRISWIGPSSSARIRPETERVDAEGAYLIPGLADMHVHLEDSADLPLYVAAGVTTVRNMRGGPRYLAMRERVVQGTLLGPTIFTSGPTLLGGRRNNPEFVMLRAPEDAERVVLEQARAGYDMIKVHSELEIPVYDRILATARRVGIPVVGHRIAEPGLTRSLRAGQVSFEHADRSLFGDRGADMDERAREIARAGAWVGTLIETRDRPGALRRGINELRGRAPPRCFGPGEGSRSVIPALRRANVRLLAGTDASLAPMRPGTALHCELAALVTVGLTPYEALTTATRNAGEFARLHLKHDVAFGTITVGARADLVLLRRNPALDISALQTPIGTVLRGRWHPAR
jgi:imidazolonepropionase-like amidohydrolase